MKEEDFFKEDKIKPGYTRVSDIIGQWGKLIGIPEAILERKKRIGIEVHAAISFNIDTKCHLPIAEDCVPYYNSYLSWREMQDGFLEKIQNTTRYYDNALMITGQPDALIKTRTNDEPMLVDWKCTFSEMPFEWELQGAFYWMLVHDADISRLSREVVFIKLDRDGGEPRVYNYGITQQVLSECMASLTTYRRLERFGKVGRTPTSKES